MSETKFRNIPMQDQSKESIEKINVALSTLAPKNTDTAILSFKVKKENKLEIKPGPAKPQSIKEAEDKFFGTESENRSFVFKRSQDGRFHMVDIISDDELKKQSLPNKIEKK